MNALLSWMPRFLANGFLGLNHAFSVQVWYISLNLIDLRKITFCSFKTEFKAKNCLLEIRASNLGGSFIYDQASNTLEQLKFTSTFKKKKILKNSVPDCFIRTSFTMVTGWYAFPLSGQSHHGTCIKDSKTKKMVEFKTHTIHGPMESAFGVKQ